MSIASKFRLFWRYVRGIHVHRWKESGFNAYGICIEKCCRGCGARRHHGWDDLVGEWPKRVGKWHDGPAPKAQDKP